jgi:hypothetical protein
MTSINTLKKELFRQWRDVNPRGRWLMTVNWMAKDLLEGKKGVFVCMGTETEREAKIKQLAADLKEIHGIEIKWSAYDTTPQGHSTIFKGFEIELLGAAPKDKKQLHFKYQKKLTAKDAEK